MEYKDRIRLAEMLRLGITKKEIAQALNFSERQIYYELKRGKRLRLHTDLSETLIYDPEKAQLLYDENMKRRGRKLTIKKVDAQDFLKHICNDIKKKVVTRCFPFSLKA